MRVYVDESGDLGWNFSHPFRRGGSSRYLCLAFLFVPKVHRKIPKRLIAGLYAKYQWASEKKCASAADSIKEEFAGLFSQMLTEYPGIKADCIVAKKENVQAHIRKDSNKLYNYMCGLVIPEYVKTLDEFEFVPDKRSIKVESGNSLSDYLQTNIWFDHGSHAVLKNQPQESHRNYCLQCVDWLANCVWDHHENTKSVPYTELQKTVRMRCLYFGH